MSSSLSDLYTEKSTDVTMVIDDQIPDTQIYPGCLQSSHKKYSPQQSSILPLIYLRGVKQKDLVSILQFM